jgi:hypothetical protein
MVSVACCDKCGHPLPDLEVMVDLTRRQQQLFLVLQRAGRRGVLYRDIMDAIYVDGLPSTNILSVMKHNMQPRLRRHGMKITVRTGPNSLWRLEAI